MFFNCIGCTSREKFALQLQARTNMLFLLAVLQAKGAEFSGAFEKWTAGSIAWCLVH